VCSVENTRWVLAQRAPESLAEGLRVETDLALVDDAGSVGMEDLDRVLDRDDVLAPRRVDVVDHRGERGRLSGAGGARDEDQAAVFLGQLLDTDGQAQVLEARHDLRDHAERERGRAALAEAVDAEAVQVRAHVGGVKLAGLAERLQLRGVRRGDRDQDRLEVLLGEGLIALERFERAVRTDDRRHLDLEMHVGRTGVDSVSEQRVEVHGWARLTSAEVRAVFRRLL
jgi:hypothetical protein